MDVIRALWTPFRAWEHLELVGLTAAPTACQNDDWIVFGLWKVKPAHEIWKIRTRTTQKPVREEREQLIGLVDVPERGKRPERLESDLSVRQLRAFSVNELILRSVVG